MSDYTHDTFVTQGELPDRLDLYEYDQLKKLYTLWTYKEAFTKAKGVGLGYDFQTIEIVKKADQVSITAGGEPIQGVKISQMVLPPGHDDCRKTGTGTGMSSLLVVFQLTEDEETQVKTVDVDSAKREGLLRLWTMKDLVKASEEAMGKNNGI